MKMYIKSICVDDQAKALSFYRDVLGFIVKHDISMGEHRWLTMESPEEPGGVELGLEPNAHPASKAYQEALMKDGIPCTAFRVDDLDAEYTRLTQKGVEFTTPPTQAGDVKIAVFNDTCGNLIQILEMAD